MRAATVLRAVSAVSGWQWVFTRGTRTLQLRRSPGRRFFGSLQLSQLTVVLQVNSALHPSGVAKSSTSFGWGKNGNVTSAGWQVTLCDAMWHVSSRSGEAILRTAIYLLLTYLLTYLLLLGSLTNPPKASSCIQGEEGGVGEEVCETGLE